MQLLFSLFFLIINYQSGFCANVASVERIPVAEDSNLFYPVINKTMILRGLDPDVGIFGDLSEGKNVERIRSIPISFLSPFGLKEGMVVQFIEEDGIQHSYKLSKKVNVLLIHKDPMDEYAKTQPYWYRYNLVLTDDIKKLENFAAEKDDFEVPRGFAYIGTNKILQSFQKEKVPTIKLKENDPIYKVQYASFSKTGENIRLAEVFKNKIYIQPQKREIDDGISLTTTIKDNNGKFFRITPNNDFLNEKYDSLIIDNSIVGYKTKLYKDPYEDGSCLELLLISKDKVEEVRMKCKLSSEN